MAFTSVEASSSNMSEVLKNVYAPWYATALNNKWLPLKRVQEKAQKANFDGEAYYWMIRFGRPHARATTEGGAVTTATTSQNKKVYETPSHQITTVEWTDHYIQLSKGKRSAFAAEIQSEMKEHMDAMSANVARQIMGDGSGIIAKLRVACDGANPTLKLDPGQARMFEVGNYIMVLDGATLSSTGRHSVASTPLRVTSHDLDDDSITTTGATTASTAVADGIMSYGAQASAVSSECNGLQMLSDDSTTLHGLDVATYPWHKGTVVKNGDAITSLDLSKFRKLLDYINVRSGKYPTILYQSAGVRRSFVALLQARQRYVDDMKLDGGGQIEAFTGPEGPIPFLADRWAPANKILAIHEPDLMWCEMGGKPRWLDADLTGSVVHLKTGYTKYESYLVWKPQLGTKTRYAHGQLTNIEEEE